MEMGAKEPKDRDARRNVSDVPRLVYLPRADATPEGELGALVNVYAFVLERYEHKRIAAEVGDGKNGANVTHSDNPSEEPSADSGSA